MSNTATLEALVKALQGIQDTLEEQTKLLRDVTYYPANDIYQPRILSSIIGAVETTPADE